MKGWGRGRRPRGGRRGRAELRVGRGAALAPRPGFAATLGALDSWPSSSRRPQRHRRAARNNEARGAGLRAASHWLRGRATLRAPLPEPAASSSAKQHWPRGGDSAGRPGRECRVAASPRWRKEVTGGGRTPELPSSMARVGRPQPGSSLRRASA
jgi:hypothetical protein